MLRRPAVNNTVAFASSTTSAARWSSPSPRNFQFLWTVLRENITHEVKKYRGSVSCVGTKWLTPVTAILVICFFKRRVVSFCFVFYRPHRFRVKANNVHWPLWDFFLKINGAYVLHNPHLFFPPAAVLRRFNFFEGHVPRVFSGRRPRYFHVSGLF